MRHVPDPEPVTAVEPAFFKTRVPAGWTLPLMFFQTLCLNRPIWQNKPCTTVPMYLYNRATRVIRELCIEWRTTDDLILHRGTLCAQRLLRRQLYKLLSRDSQVYLHTLPAWVCLRGVPNRLFFLPMYLSMKYGGLPLLGPIPRPPLQSDEVRSDEDQCSTG